MIGILLNDSAYEQDIRELLMAFCPGEEIVHEAHPSLRFCVEGILSEDRTEFELCLVFEGGSSFRALAMEALEPEVPGVKFCKVNVDDERDLAMEFQIESIPTLLCVKGGKAVKRLVGFREKDALKKELEAL